MRWHMRCWKADSNLIRRFPVERSHRKPKVRNPHATQRLAPPDTLRQQQTEISLSMSRSVQLGRALAAVLSHLATLRSRLSRK